MKMLKKVCLVSLFCLGFLYWARFTPANAWVYASELNSYDTPGFFRGFWHGLISPIALFAQLFNDDIVLYSPFNSGFFYNLGFLLGLSVIIGGSKSGYDSARGDKEDDDEEDDEEASENY